MHVANILVIAPYPEMLPELQDVANEFPDASFSFETGDLGHGLASALKMFHLDFDVVISRGGTAQILEDELSIPVVEMGITAPDLVSSFSGLPKNTTCVAAVGFRNVLQNIKPLTGLLPFEVDFYAIDFEDELEEALQDALDNEYDAVVCDTKAFNQARLMGAEAHLLVSGKDSIRAAFSHAVQICELNGALEERTHFLQEMLRSCGIDLVVYTPDGRLVYSGLSERDHSLLDDLKRYIQSGNGHRFVIRRNGRIYTIRLKTTDFEETKLATFTVSSVNAPNPDRFMGIEHLNADDVQVDYERSVVHIIQGDRTLAPLAEAAQRAKQPILLVGEPRCGKTQLAQIIYLTGDYKDRPLVRVDCRLLNDKSWNYLIDSYHSPLYESDCTIFFHEVDQLEDERWRALLTAIKETRLAERSRLIFSSDYTGAADVSQASGIIAEQLRCITLTVPPLRTWNVLEGAADRYLQHLAKEKSADAPLLDPAAAELLAQHPWKGNLAQFRSIISWLDMAHEGSNITARDVLDAFDRREVSGIPGSFAGREGKNVSLIRPLNEINRDAATAALAHCHGNKSEAASILGVSRTTLYKLLEQSQTQAARNQT